jgi:hypothetical protein
MSTSAWSLARALPPSAVRAVVVVVVVVVLADLGLGAGGLLQYADHRGLPEVVAKLKVR